MLFFVMLLTKILGHCTNETTIFEAAKGELMSKYVDYSV